MIEVVLNYMRIDFLVSEGEETAGASHFSIAQFWREQAAGLDNDDDAEAVALEIRERARTSTQAHERAERQAPGVQPGTASHMGDTSCVDERMHEEFNGLKSMWIIPTFVSLFIIIPEYIN